MLRHLGGVSLRYPKIRVYYRRFVQQQYLTHRQVPHFNPPEYKFCWDRRSNPEVMKMEVLGFVAKLRKEENPSTGQYSPVRPSQRRPTGPEQC